MFRASLPGRSNGTKPVLGEQCQCARHRGVLRHRGNSQFPHCRPCIPNETYIGGRIVAVLRESANRGEDEATEDFQGRPDSQEGRPPKGVYPSLTQMRACSNRVVVGAQVHLPGIRPRVSRFVRVSAERCLPRGMGQTRQVERV
jgi:hypothetical protein